MDKIDNEATVVFLRSRGEAGADAAKQAAFDQARVHIEAFDMLVSEMLDARSRAFDQGEDRDQHLGRAVELATLISTMPAPLPRHIFLKSQILEEEMTRAADGDSDAAARALVMFAGLKGDLLRSRAMQTD